MGILRIAKNLIFRGKNTTQEVRKDSSDSKSVEKNLNDIDSHIIQGGNLANSILSAVVDNKTPQYSISSLVPILKKIQENNAKYKKILENYSKIKNVGHIADEVLAGESQYLISESNQVIQMLTILNNLKNTLDNKRKEFTLGILYKENDLKEFFDRLIGNLNTWNAAFKTYKEESQRKQVAAA